MHHDDKERKQRQQQRIMLNAAIRESLLLLGEPIMKTIMWHMHLKGFRLDDSYDTDIEIFFNYLTEIVGNVADVVMSDIYSNLESKCFAQYAKGQNTLLLAGSHPEGKLHRPSWGFTSNDDISSVDKIRLLLASYIGDNSNNFGEEKGEKENK